MAAEREGGGGCRPPDAACDTGGEGKPMQCDSVGADGSGKRDTNRARSRSAGRRNAAEGDAALRVESGGLEDGLRGRGKAPEGSIHSSVGSFHGGNLQAAAPAGHDAVHLDEDQGGDAAMADVNLDLSTSRGWSPCAPGGLPMFPEDASTAAFPTRVGALRPLATTDLRLERPCPRDVCQKAAIEKSGQMDTPRGDRQVPHAGTPVGSPWTKSPPRLGAGALPPRAPATGLGAQPATSAWSRTKVSAFPPSDELGDLSTDGDTIRLENTILEDNIKNFETALVGRMFGRRIPFDYLSKELHRRWEGYGPFKMVMICADCFVCYFNHVANRDAILMGGPWIVAGQVIGLDKWSKSFSPRSRDAFNTPVWVRLPGLPLHCWDIRSLARIATYLGEPLWIDDATKNMSRGAYARVCIRIDLSKPLKPGVWMEGLDVRFYQPIEYEGLSLFCFNCGQVGHRATNCRVNCTHTPAETTVERQPTASQAQVQPTVGGSAQPRMAGSSSHNVHGTVPVTGVGLQRDSTPHIIATPGGSVDTGEAGEDGERGVGPWMMVTRKKKPLRSSSDGRQSLKQVTAAPGRAKKPAPSSSGVASEPFGTPPKSLRNVLLESSDNPFSCSGSATPIPGKFWTDDSTTNLVFGSSPAGKTNGRRSPKKFTTVRTAEAYREQGEQRTTPVKVSGDMVAATPKTHKKKNRNRKPSQSFVNRMTRELGPTEDGDRKKRKQATRSDGGDGSSSVPI